MMMRRPLVGASQCGANMPLSQATPSHDQDALGGVKPFGGNCQATRRKHLRLRLLRNAPHDRQEQARIFVSAEAEQD